MKKLTMICMSALLMLAVSCKKDKNDEIENPGSGFRATVESHEGNSKTHLDSVAVKWVSGDTILVKSSTCSTPKRFITTGTGASANFGAAESLPTDFYTPNYTAYYPANMFEGNEIDLPDWQDYEENTFANGANPMAATSSDNVLPFKNICGVLELQLYSEKECYVSMIEIASNTGEQLWGHGTVTLTDGIPSLSIVPEDDDQSSLWLYPDDDVALGTSSKAPTAFYFVVPAGTLGTSFTVTVYDEDDNVWRKTANSTQNLIGRSRITVMPPLPVETKPDVEVTTIPNCFNCIYTFSGSVDIEGTGECEYGFVYAKTTDNADPTIGGTDCVKFRVNTDDFTYYYSKEFTADIPNMHFEESTDYTYRAYCICNGVNYYGDSYFYTTPKPLPSNWVNGINPHQFTVASGRVVYFSQGNLQYNASGSSASAVSGANVGGTWRFAEHQFDFVGNDTVGNVYEGGMKSNNANIAQTYDGWIDLFGWGTSGYNHGATCYQPWSTSYGHEKYFAYGSGNNNLYDPDGTADWGYNAISNGGNTVDSGWRTLTSDEWYYLIEERPNLYGQGKVGSCIPGLIILPDNWKWTGDVAPFEASWVPGESDWVNVYNYSEWAKMEAAGAVFLPAAGGRTNFGGIEVGNVGGTGFYWSSSYKEGVTPLQYAYDLFIHSKWIEPNRYDNNSRDYGFSVRLVRPAE